MKTTKKEFVQHVRNYVEYAVNEDDNYTLQDVDKAFKEWYKYNKGNLSEKFMEWLQCIPSEIYVTPFFQEQEDIMASWFENCGEQYDRKRFKPETFYWLVTREFNNLLKGAN